jgi:Lar family restriction alleviation protein
MRNPLILSFAAPARCKSKNGLSRPRRTRRITKLKSCPFCGCKSIDIIRIKDSFWDSGETYHAKCSNCNVETQFYFRKIDVIEAWNRRDGNG